MTPRDFDEDLLTEEAALQYEEYLEIFDDMSCYCGITNMPPCGYCEGGGTHPGNPDNLLDTDSAWNQALLLILPDA